MTFYLLTVVVALTTIFGLAHSQTACETLHLQDVYKWTIETLQQQFELDNSGNQEDPNDNQILDILEITLDQLEAANSVKNESSDPVKKIQADQAKVSESSTTHLIDEIQVTSTTADVKTDEVRTNNDTTPAEPVWTTNNEMLGTRTTTESEVNAFKAMKSSLHKLISAANSGKLSGGQLYEVLVQETAAHDRRESDSRRSKEKSEIDGSAPSTVRIEEIDENGQIVEKREVKPRMYFGEAPLEYVPHQRG